MQKVLFPTMTLWNFPTDSVEIIIKNQMAKWEIHKHLMHERNKSLENTVELFPSHTGSIRMLLAFGSESDPNSNCSSLAWSASSPNWSYVRSDVGTSTSPLTCRHSEDSH